MRKPGRDGRALLGFTGAVLVMITITGILAPERADRNPIPTTWNSGAAGAKAAWLMLAQLGYHEVRWEHPDAELATIDAEHATLILADPSPSPATFTDKNREQPFREFLGRGGRIIATGASAAILLPNAHVSRSDRLDTDLCFTSPAGAGALARAGEVAMAAPDRWIAGDPSVRVAQLCGEEPVVVSYAVGRGQVIWWASSTPLTNQGLHNDGNLRLLLASIGPADRTLYFDEYLHGISESAWIATRGTPLPGIVLQACCVAALVLFSLARGTGPHRPLIQRPRTSPLEFVESMGELYARAGASSVAISAARRRLAEFLTHEAGIPASTLRQGPGPTAAALQTRFGCETVQIEADLEAAERAEYVACSAAAALNAVQRMDHDIAMLRARIRRPQENPRRRPGAA